MHQDQITRMRAQLQQDREATLDILENLSAGLDMSLKESISEDSPIDNHPADIASETFERGKDFALREEQLQRLKQIDAALERIEQGTYGRCLNCGHDIPAERLALLPQTGYCTHCADNLEATHRDRPVEEPLLNEIAKRSFSDLTARENAAFDGEDTWQAVARYGTSNTPGDFSQAEDYGDTYINADEPIGTVWDEDALPSSYDRSKGQYVRRGIPLGSTEQKRIVRQNKPRE